AEHEPSLHAAHPERQPDPRPKLAVEPGDRELEVLLGVARLDRRVVKDDIWKAPSRASIRAGAGALGLGLALRGLPFRAVGLRRLGLRGLARVAAAHLLQDGVQVVVVAAAHGVYAQPLDLDRAPHPEHDAEGDREAGDGGQRRTAAPGMVRSSSTIRPKPPRPCPTVTARPSLLERRLSQRCAARAPTAN